VPSGTFFLASLCPWHVNLSVESLKKSIFILALAGTAQTWGQNLVPNPDFSEMRSCPMGFNQHRLTHVVSWDQIADGTPDYFNVCSSKMGVPDNLFGHQQAKAGNAYAGVVTYSGNKRDYREYLSAKLTEPLSPGTMYCIEMYVAPAAKSEFITDGIGLALTKKAPTDRGTLDIPVALQNPRLHILDQFGEWVLLSDVFVAEGGESFITIGNFKKDKMFSVLRRNLAKNESATGNNWSYVFIDAVSIKEIRSKEECSCTVEYIAKHVHDPPLQLSELRELELRNVLFDFDDSELTAQAQTDLNEVANILRRNKTYYIEVSGHTDIIGREGYNLDLSRRRAESVLEFLGKKGISTERLTVGYFGSTMPVAENETAEGRAQNRRVEFKILEKKYEQVK
jgi:OmpA-OmpF porin, OOP family